MTKDEAKWGRFLLCILSSASKVTLHLSFPPFQTEFDHNEYRNIKDTIKENATVAFLLIVFPCQATQVLLEQMLSIYAQYLRIYWSTKRVQTS